MSVASATSAIGLREAPRLPEQKPHTPTRKLKGKSSEEDKRGDAVDEAGVQQPEITTGSRRQAKPPSSARSLESHRNGMCGLLGLLVSPFDWTLGWQAERSVVKVMQDANDCLGLPLFLVRLNDLAWQRASIR